MAKEKFYSKYTNSQIENLLETYDDKSFVIYYDKPNQVYRFFRTEERKEDWIEEYDRAGGELGAMDASIAAYQFTDPFTAPAPYSMTVTVINDNGYILYGSTGNYLNFSTSTTPGNSLDPINESIDVYYTFKSSAGTVQASAIYNYPTSNIMFNMDQYLNLGDNTITISVKGRSTGAVKTVVAIMHVLELDLSSSFDISKAFAKNSVIPIPYRVKGEYAKKVTIYIDGTAVVNISHQYGDSDVTNVYSYDNTAGTYAPGKHTIQLIAQLEGVQSNFYSPLLYFEFVISGSEIPYMILVTNEFARGTTAIAPQEFPGFTGEQYVAKNIEWAYYSSNQKNKQATIQWRLKDGGGNETSIAYRQADVVAAETDKAPDPIKFVPASYGNYQLEALIDSSVIGTYTISVVKNTAGISEATNGMRLKLSALGRSNSEPATTLSTWQKVDGGRTYTTTFNNVPWNAVSGWNNDALCLCNGATAYVNCKPFDSTEIMAVSKYGCVFEVELETYNVADSDDVVLSISDPNDNSHLTITTNKAVLVGSMGSTLTVRFKDNERVKLAFIVYPRTEFAPDAYRGMTFVMSNGVYSRGIKYQENETYNIGSYAEATNGGYIKMGSTTGLSCVKIYSMRTYSMFIDWKSEMYNYFIDCGDDIQALMNKNEIYSSGSIDVDKLESLVTTIEIIGDLDQIIGPDKGKEIKLDVKLKVVSPDSPETNMHCDHAQVYKAGQSTLDLPVPSLHVKLDKNNNICYDRDDKQLPKNRWAFNKVNTPEKKFRLQANYMESSGCHNGAFLKLVSEVVPNVTISEGGVNKNVLMPPAQDYALNKYQAAMKAKYPGKEDPTGNDWRFPYTLRMTPDSKPCIIVWKKKDSDTKYNFLGQYVMMEEKNSNFTNCMRSIYDSVDSEGAPDPFNFKSSSKGDRLWDNSNCYQFEILNSEHPISTFTSYATWDASKEAAFELEYPDKDDVEDVNVVWSYFKNDFVVPVTNACNSNNQADFDALYMTKFDRWQWAAYYCLLLRNAASDSGVRNMELTTYDGSTWLPKWWDVDMQCGLDQGSGDCIVEPGSDMDTRLPSGAIALSGKSTSKLWQKLLTCNQFNNDVITMDKALYRAGWTYSNMTELQDEQYIDVWSKSMYNETGIIKYIEQNRLLSLQGDRTSHRHWFLKSSYDYFDSLHVCGDYTSSYIGFRLNGYNSQQAGKSVKIVAATEGYFGWMKTQMPQQTGIHLKRDASYNIALNEAIDVKDPFQILGADKLKEIDYSQIARYIQSGGTFGGAYNSVTGSTLTKLILGIPKTDMNNGVFNTFIVPSEFNTINEYIKTLEYLDIQGWDSSSASEPANIPISNMPSLKYFYAAGSNRTVFNPADGASFTKIELPTTIRSMSMNGCGITDDSSNCVIDWYAPVYDASNNKTGIEKVNVPPLMDILTFKAMGRENGVKQLVTQWVNVIDQSNKNFDDYTLYCSDVRWYDVSVNDIMLLSKIPSVQCGKVANNTGLTGYICCNDSFTVSQMNELMDAFGPDVFSLNNIICIDSTNPVLNISATGPGVTAVAGSNTIEVLQGTTATFSAAGFPISSVSTYKWGVGSNQEMDGAYWSFGGYGNNNNTLYNTGVLVTNECDAEDTTYRIYATRYNAEGTFMARGYIDVVIKKRTYPQDASIILAKYPSTVDKVKVADGVYQIEKEGTYVFDASHFNPSNYTGTMDTSGGTWTLDGYNSSYITRATSGYTQGKNENTEYIMNIQNLPDEDYNMTLKYTSKWKNNSTVNATNLELCLTKIIAALLTNANNKALFYAFVKSGLEKSAHNAYSSFELKQANGTYNFKELLETTEGAVVADLLNTKAGNLDVLSYLNAAIGLNFTDCSALSGDISIKKCKALAKILLSHTNTTDVSINDGQAINELTMGHPHNLTLLNLPNIAFEGMDVSAGYVSRTRIPYDSSVNPVSTYNGFPCGAEVHYGTDDVSMLSGIDSSNFKIDDVHYLENIEVYTKKSGAIKMLAKIQEAIESKDRMVVDRIDSSVCYIHGEYGKATKNPVTEQWEYIIQEQLNLPISEYISAIGEASHTGFSVFTRSVSGKVELESGKEYSDDTNAIVARMLTPAEVRDILMTDASAELYAAQMGFEDLGTAINQIGTAITTGRNKLAKVVDGVEVSRIVISDNASMHPSCSDLNDVDGEGNVMDAVGIVEIRSMRDLKVKPNLFGIKQIGAGNIL